MSGIYGAAGRKPARKEDLEKARKALALLKAQKARGETAIQRIEMQSASLAMQENNRKTGIEKVAKVDSKKPAENYRKAFDPNEGGTAVQKAPIKKPFKEQPPSKGLADRPLPTHKYGVANKYENKEDEFDQPSYPVIPSKHFDQAFGSKPVFNPSLKPPMAPQDDDDIDEVSDDDRPIKVAKPIPPKEAYEKVPTSTCRYCERTFNLETLPKHEKVCQERPDKKKRKVFDSSKAREAAPEQHELKTTGKAKPMGKAKGVGGKKVPKWKIQSEQFRAAMKNTKVQEEGGSPPPPIDPAYDEKSYYVQCPTCGRSFNEQAAKRHIPFCASKQKMDMYKNPQKSHPSAGNFKKR